MAYIPNNSVISYYQASGQGTNFVFPEPLDAQVGDFICFTVMNVSGAGSAMTATGYSTPPGGVTTTISSVSRVQAFYREVTSLPVGSITVVGQDAEFLAEVWLVRKADATTPFDVNIVNTDFTSNVASQTVNGITTTNDNCLIVYSSHLRTSGRQLPSIAEMDDVVYLDKYASGVLANSLVGYRVQRTAGAAPSLGTINDIASTSTGRAFTFAFRDVAPSTPTLPPEVSANSEIIKLHMGTTGAGTPTSSFSRNETTTWADGNTVTATTIDGLGIIAASPTMSQTAFTDNDNESTWGWSTIGSIGISGVDATGRWVGFTHSLTSTDMSNKIFALTFGMNSIVSSNVGAKGCIVYFEDSTGEWAAFTLSKRDGMQINVPYTTFIALDSATPLDESGAIDWTDITDMAFYYHRVTTSTLSRGMYIRLAALIGEPVVYGGSEDSPITTSFLSRVMQGWAGFNLAPNQVREQLVAKGSFTIGNGTNKTVAELSANSIVQPTLPDGSFDGQFWQGATEFITTKFNTSSDDIIRFNRAALVSPQDGVEQFLDVSAGSAPAEFTTNGTTIIGQIVTGATGRNFNRTTFDRCGLITLGGSQLANCTVSDSSSTPAVLTADPSDISDTVFVSAGTGHAIQASATGTFAFEGNTFSGYGADGTTDAAFYNNSGGLITLEIPAGDATPTVRNGAGASTVIDTPTANQSVTISGATAGSRIQIYDLTSATELYNGTPTFPHTWTDASPYAADREIRLRVALVGASTAKKFISTTIGTSTSATPALSYLVTQEDDTVYASNGVDGSTVTDVVKNSGTDRIEINKASGTITAASLYAYEMYYLFTSTGIAADPQVITAVDTANYFVGSSYKFKNVTTGPNVALTITGGWLRDSSTGLSITTVDTTGYTLYNAPDHVVAYATGSGVTAGDITAIAAAVDSELADDFAAVPTVAEIADGVLDEALSGHTTAGTVGKAIADIETDAATAAAGGASPDYINTKTKEILTPLS